MRKNKKNTNILIKRSRLVRIARSKGIRIGKEALENAEKSIYHFANVLLEAAKENMIVHGRRNLKKDDVIAGLTQLKKEENTLLDIAGK